MANINRDFYIKQSTCMQLLEAYKSMEDALGEERKELLDDIDRVSGQWEGPAAQTTCHMTKNLLQEGIYDQSYREVIAMRRCLEEILPWIEDLLDRSEGFPDQLRNDDYVEPAIPAEGDNHIRNGGVLSMNYGGFEQIRQCCDEIMERTDFVTQNLRGVIEDCGYLLDDMDETLEGIEAASRKLHRVGNYQKSLTIFANGIQKLESYIIEQMCAIAKDEKNLNGETARTEGMTVPNTDSSGEQLVTMQQMEDFGFTITEDGLDKLNRILRENGVTDIGSIALFMATCGHESKMGNDLLEDYSGEKDYTFEKRGAGYIQITGKDQEAFYAQCLEKAVPDNPAQDIAENYAWESAVWEWAVQEKGKKVKLNNYVTEYGYGEGIFLVTQYFINSYLPKEKYPYFDSDLRAIRKGEAEFECDLKAGILSVNGRKYRLPENYEDRLEKYKKAVNSFIGESDENSNE